MMMDFTDLLPSEMKGKTESRVNHVEKKEKTRTFMCLAWSAIGQLSE